MPEQGCKLLAAAVSCPTRVVLDGGSSGIKSPEPGALSDTGARSEADSSLQLCRTVGKTDLVGVLRIWTVQT